MNYTDREEVRDENFLIYNWIVIFTYGILSFLITTTIGVIGVAFRGGISKEINGLMQLQQF